MTRGLVIDSASWFENGQSTSSTDNGAISLTFAAPTGSPAKRHYLNYIAWSYSATPAAGAGRLTVDAGTSTAKFDVDITAGGPGAFHLPPLGGNANGAIVVNLSAGGTGVIGKLNAYVFTE